MSRRRQGPWTGGGTLLTLVAVVLFVWGFERWRRHASHRAGVSERARLEALSRCLLGPDAHAVLRSPDAVRARLRALAMDTPAEGAVTWFDRCVPLASALARHASEVDDTGAINEAQTQVSETSRALARSVERVGLVWRIRAGDPETDMDPVAQNLLRASSELQLAGGAPIDVDPAGPVAPAPSAMPVGELVPTPGLEPTSIGTPERFFVGAPLPSVTEVVREGGRWTLDVRANEPSVAWRAMPTGVVRIDVLVDPSEDGLAPLRVFRPGDETEEARVTPVNSPLDGLHASLDAVSAGRGLWLAQWTPWAGTALARFAPGRAATALELAAPRAELAARAADPEAGRSTALDEHVAVAPLGRGVVVAYTQRARADATELFLATTLADSDRAAVRRVGAREVAGRAPELGFCASPGGPLTLFVAGAHEWLALAVDERGVSERARVAATGAGGFDERLAVRCAADGALVYAREHPRESPVLRCDAARCEALRAPEAPVLATMPLYETRTPSDRALAHGEWPVVFADAGGTLLAARAAGPVVALARRTPGSATWQPERVLFDAAARSHGATVQGLGLYAQGGEALLAVATAEGLRLFRSGDRGERWR